MGQAEECAEPLLLALAEHLHVDPGTSAAGDGADGDCHNVQQLMSLAALYPRVLQVPKMVHDLRTLSPLHHSHSHHINTEIRSFLDKLIIKAESTERVGIEGVLKA